MLWLLMGKSQQLFSHEQTNSTCMMRKKRKWIFAKVIQLRTFSYSVFRPVCAISVWCWCLTTRAAQHRALKLNKYSSFHFHFDVQWSIVWTTTANTPAAKNRASPRTAAFSVYFSTVHTTTQTPNKPSNFQSKLLLKRVNEEYENKLNQMWRNIITSVYRYRRTMCIGLHWVELGAAARLIETLWYWLDWSC